MNTLEQSFAQNIDTAETGLNRYVGDDGNLYTQDDIDRESFQAMSRKERRDAPAIITPQEGLQRFTEAMGGAALGAVPGAVAGTVGAPGDIIGLLAGAYEGLTAEEGQGLDAFLNTMAGISEDYGSEVVLRFIRETADVLPVSDQVKEGIKAGAEVGSFVGVGGAVTAGAKGTAKAARTMKGMVGEPFETPRTPSATGTLQEVSKGEFEVRPGSADTEAGLPTATFEATEPDFIKFKESGVPVEQLWDHPHVENTTKNMMSRPTTQQQAGEAWTKEMLDAKQPPKKEWRESRELIDPKTGSKIKGWEAAVEYLVDHSKTFAWADDSQWMKANAGKIPENPVKNDRELIIIFGPPAAGKSTLANPIARSKNAAIVDADEAKKLIPGYDDGVGANVVHEESSSLNELVFSATIKEGDNVVLPIVGGRPEKVIQKYIGPAKKNGYKVTLVDMMVEPDEAVNRMFNRFISKKRLIPYKVATVGRGPTETFDALVEQGAADAYTKIDNNPGIGEPRIVIRDDEGLIEAAGIDFRKLDGEGGQRSTGDVEPGDASPSPASSGQAQGPEATVKPRRRTRRKK